MLKIFLLIVLFIHGMIHLLGFFKAYQLAKINQLTQNISRPMGILWLIALILFLAAAIQLISNHDLWWITASCRSNLITSSNNFILAGC